MPGPKAFSDISSDQRVVELLTKLYEKPENVEFYVGLFAEDVTPNSPLPPLLRRLVAVDAFSQALTNPLLSKNVYGHTVNKISAFTNSGIEVIDKKGRRTSISCAAKVNGG